MTRAVSSQEPGAWLLQEFYESRSMEQLELGAWNVDHLFIDDDTNSGHITTWSIERRVKRKYVQVSQKMKRRLKHVIWWEMIIKRWLFPRIWRNQPAAAERAAERAAAEDECWDWSSLTDWHSDTPFLRYCQIILSFLYIYRWRDSLSGIRPISENKIFKLPWTRKSSRLSQ